MDSEALTLPDAAEGVLGVVDKLSGTEVTTYGDVAAHLGLGARQVGRIMREYGHLTHWWRVVRADGRSHDPARAVELFDACGITHRCGRVDLQKHRVGLN